MNRERLKTLILSVLVCLSIFLTQQLWFPYPMEIFKSEATDGRINTMAVSKERKKIVSPSAVVVSFGAGDKRTNQYTILSSNLDMVWNESKDILKSYFLGDAEIKSVSKESYVQSNLLKSIELEFPKNTPAILVSSHFDSFDNKIVKNVKVINKILIPALNRGTIYIVDNEENVFEVKLPKYEENSALIGFIDDLAKVEHIKYHPIFSHLDEQGGNYTPIPVTYSTLATQTVVESEIDITDDLILIEKAKKFFNKSFDFVKSIREANGAVVYIYGYGEKTLRISSKGALEYNEEIGNISSTNIVDSLDAAVEFMLQKRDSLDNLYLKEIKKTSDNTGYLFGFSYRIGGYSVETKDSEVKQPIEVEVYGDKVKVYRSSVRKLMDIKGFTPEQLVINFPSIIDKNIKNLKTEYFNTGVQPEEEMDDSSKISEILKNIEEVRMVYFDTMEEYKGQILKPSWRVKIKGDVYYFDSYTGDLIGRGSSNNVTFK
ncbi:hypothetical protein Clos_2781 [Alkaliphilus oremlandii OhILAs]|uniref:Uncharacterized protein n=2 Tax=Alkaliphilus oremlandii TaxID=461876 RepID=A8MKI0_ALKOO|nr:hypothetical protein Clos_2781 [Alkaliphilus oremlandii OhILAs]